MKSKLRQPKDTIYQLHISLQASEPLIWRRVQVAGDTRLVDLHFIIQLLMEWDGEHPHEFRVRGTCFKCADATLSSPWVGHAVDERDVRLIQLALVPGLQFAYIYDFGDYWVHLIEVEQVLQREHGAQYPICLDGARSGPPEDSGGVGGYEWKLEVLSDPDHEEYEWVHEWMGDWDPERFDIDEINEDLRRAFPERPSRRR